MRFIMILSVLHWASSLRVGRVLSISRYTTQPAGRARDIRLSETPENRNFKDDFVGTRLFVQNIPLNCDWKRLKDHFKTAGSVVYASISCDPVTKVSRGHGIIQYETTNEANHALATMNNKMLGDSELRLRKDLQERRSADKNAIKKTHWSEQPPKVGRPAANSAVRPGDQPRADIIKKRDEKKTSVQKEKPTNLPPQSVPPTAASSVREPIVNISPEKIETTEKRSLLSRKVVRVKDPVEVAKTLHKKTLLNLLDNEEDVEEEEQEEEEAVEDEESVSESEIQQQHEFVRIKKSVAMKAALKASGIWTHDTSSSTQSVSEENIALIHSIVMERESFRNKKLFERADEIRMSLRREMRVQLDDSKQQWRVLPEKEIPL
jgi:hypothetical protein